MKIESKLISVIVPVYNTSKYLPQCLDSLLNQTYPNLEIICVDDGSTDNSWEVLQEYAAKDNRVKVFHQENAGVSVARNKALAHATGEWLSFIDSDDWLDLDTYEKCVNGMRSDVDVVFFGARLDWEDENRAKECDPKLAPDIEGYSDINHNVILKNVRTVTNRIIRHDLWKRYELVFPENRSYAEDAVVCLCVLSVARKIFCLTNRFYHYRRHQSSAIMQTILGHSEKKILDFIYSWHYVYEFRKKWGLSCVVKKTLPFLFWSDARKAEELASVELKEMVRQEAIATAKKMGIFQVERCAGNLHLLREQRMKVEKSFHWYRNNCECFGLLGKSIWSITYYPTFKVHRFMGKKIFLTHYKELK